MCLVFDSNELLHAQQYPAVIQPGASSDNVGLSAANRMQGAQTPRRGASDAVKPPKKPLTPYMIFSKRVSAHFTLHGCIGFICVKALVTELYMIL